MSIDIDDPTLVVSKEWLHYPRTMALPHPCRPARDPIAEPMPSEPRPCGPTGDEDHPADDSLIMITELFYLILGADLLART